ncbi:MAG TPA: hypothetical protein VMX17_03435 [Candidatus Glassbacteria bacterium]|nr:hypothetical protein [Candidatus Glassbacteria bacterium]
MQNERGRIIKWFQKAEYTKYTKPWHKWFAWYPVMVGHNSSGDKIMIWLDIVLRVGYKSFDDDGGSHWDYFYKRI